MHNDRPLDNPHMQTVLEEFARLCERYDLVGACTVIDAHEMGYRYHLDATWNGVIPDDTLPLGVRIRFKTAELGEERARAFAEGTAWTFGGLLDFGMQTRAWAQDFLQILRKAGLRIQHTPFGGRKLPRIGGHNLT